MKKPCPQTWTISGIFIPAGGDSSLPNKFRRNIFRLELEGRLVLGFDTGLDERSFARLGAGRLLTSPGAIVYPDGKIETWLPGGVSVYIPPESTPPGCGNSSMYTSMVVWGPFFPDERLDWIISDSSRRDEALDALCYWLKARMVLGEKNIKTSFYNAEAPFPGPAGALIAGGTVFFPPAPLIKRTLEAEGSGAILGAEQWIHPDLNGNDAVTFSAGAMLYSIFCGAPPFYEHKDETPDPEKLRNIIREGSFIPPRLATPGLDPEMAALISNALNCSGQGSRQDSRQELKAGTPCPSPQSIAELIGPASSKAVSSWIKALNADEILSTQAEKERYSKKKSRSKKARRFFLHNRVIIATLAICLAAAGLFIINAGKRRTEKPNTTGMEAAAVAEAYYNAFNTLDHTMMEACVTKKAGRNDIDMIVSLFVISRVRQAYESNQTNIIPASEWLVAGRPATDKTVFGITDLKIKIISEDSRNARVAADYILWMPGEASPEEQIISDKLDLVFLKNAWHIEKIERGVSS